MRQLMLLAFLAAPVVLHTPDVRADVTDEQKDQLSEIYKSLRDARKLVSKKKFNEIREAVQDAESKVQAMELSEDEKDRTYKNVVKQLAYLKDKLPVSFEKEIAPIIKDKCVRCHGANRQSGKLRLDTFNQMAKGGANGPLVRGTNPRNSLLVLRMATPNDKLRMPKGGAALPKEQIELIAKWVSQGSPYDGTDRDSMIGTSPPDKPKPKPLKIARPDGSETVSFKKDVAPWMVGVCLGCHGDRNPRNGFSMSTFEKMLTTGESAPVIVPGDPDSSYIVDLVLRQDPMKMPAGNQTRIKRSQALALEKWIKEGAKFDGDDPKATLRSLVPTEAELEAQRLANMSDSDFSARRLKQGQDLWKRVLPRDEVLHIETENFYVFGEDDARIKQVGQWAEADLTKLKEFYGFDSSPVWRGRLSIFVAKDRFAYSEFNQVVFNRETPREMIGHSVVTADFNQAYMVLRDVGDEVSDATMGMRSNVTAQLAESFLQRQGATPPRVIARGAGLLMAHSSTDKDDPWFAALPARMKSAVVTKASDVFNDGTFSRGEMDAVSFAMARFLSRAGKARYVKLVKELQAGSALPASVRKVYGKTPGSVGELFLKSLR